MTTEELSGQRAYSSNWHRIAARCVLFLSLYVGILATWPVIEEAYSHAFCGAQYVALLPLAGDATVTCLGAGALAQADVSFDVLVRVIVDRPSSSLPFYLSSRDMSFGPTAMLVALVLATPLGTARLAVILIGSVFLLNALLLGATTLLVIGLSAVPTSLLRLGVTPLAAVLDHAEVFAAFPALIWLVSTQSRVIVGSIRPSTS